MTRFEKMEGYPDEIQGRFNSFITTQFDDSLSVEMQIRSLIKWINSSRDLVNDMVDYINLFIEMFDERLQEEIVGRLNEWLEDGTLAQIINNDVFDMKADKTFVDSEIERLDQKDENIITHIDSEIERLNQKDENIITHVDSEIKRLDQKDEETDTKIDELKTDITRKVNVLNDRKREKGTGLIYLSDYTQLENESDDQFINRLLQEIPILNTDTGFREGILVLEAKEYMLEDSIVLGQYQQLEGSGRSTRLLLENSYKPIILIDDGDNSSYGNVIKNLSLFGSNLNTGISINRATHLYMENVYIYNVEKGIHGGSVWLAHFNRVSVRNQHSMGEYGIQIRSPQGENLTSTSLLFNNTWVKNFKRGYDVGTALYSTFNATACDTFTNYAYNGGSAVTYNSAGAEDGQLIDNGFVFGAGARQTVYNTPNVMSIKYTGSNNAYIFNFEGTPATINGFRWQAGEIPDNLLYMNLQNQAQVNLFGSYFPSTKSGRDRFNFGHQHSSVFEQSNRLIRHYDRYTMNTISDLSAG